MFTITSRRTHCAISTIYPRIRGSVYHQGRCLASLAEVLVSCSLILCMVLSCLDRLSSLIIRFGYQSSTFQSSNLLQMLQKSFEQQAKSSLHSKKLGSCTSPIMAYPRLWSTMCSRRRVHLYPPFDYTSLIPALFV